VTLIDQLKTTLLEILKSEQAVKPRRREIPVRSRNRAPVSATCSTLSRDFRSPSQLLDRSPGRRALTVPVHTENNGLQRCPPTPAPRDMCHEASSHGPTPAQAPSLSKLRARVRFSSPAPTPAARTVGVQCTTAACRNHSDQRACPGHDLRPNPRRDEVAAQLQFGVEDPPGCSTRTMRSGSAAGLVAICLKNVCTGARFRHSPRSRTTFGGDQGLRAVCVPWS
jgi:hypothetical protein